MRTIRTFLAIPLPSSLAGDALEWVYEMRDDEGKAKPLAIWNPPPKKKQASSSPASRSEAGSSMGIKWVPEDNLHLTLKFLGEVENVETPAICNVLADICSGFDPFELLFGGASFLPDVERARTLTVSIEDATNSLTQIVSLMEERYADMGFKREPRDYVPHLTLGRVRSGSRRASSTVIEKWQRHQDDQLGAMTVNKIQVIGSFLEKQGPTYNVMNTVEL
ncbi:RNA 2',3'-cyclic phosphodiesterase [Neorhodopirellula lusitana]|uniref:RNA 2',3'-cyclic phosphodiesterase n=1 Tax=Neorhodopirellula lusitana TaxID=445327 RepID=UPI0038506365